MDNSTLIVDNSTLIMDNSTLLMDNNMPIMDHSMLNVDFQDGLENFTFDLYNAVQKSGNEVLSPFSITAALLFLMLGTDGTTKTQMSTTIFKDNMINNIHSSYQTLSDHLIERTMGGVTLSVANRLFGQQGINILSNYTMNAQNYYGSELETLNFATQTEQARQRINLWIAAQTNDRIKEMIPHGSLNAETVMVLVNAIYFKGDWETPFDPKNTRKMNFYVSQNVQKQVDMMYRKGNANAGVDLALDAKILELPYDGGNLSMIFLLPMSDNGISQLESQLNPETFDRIYSSAKEQETIINIPKFHIENGYQLKQILSSLGMTEIFDSISADFGKMVTSPPKVYVSEAQHKAFIEVSEEGTEAAAVTGIQISTLSLGPPPFEFNADHPFLFMIRENDSGTILFMGRYADP